MLTVRKNRVVLHKCSPEASLRFLIPRHKIGQRLGGNEDHWVVVLIVAEQQPARQETNRLSNSIPCP